ncbi:sphingosine 1-phosphate receptor 1-like [Oculina patagonica]
MANDTSTEDFSLVSSCFHLPDPDFDKVSERFTMNLATAIINIIASPLAVISNSLIVIAIFSSSRLRTPSNLFIGCLALSDVFVGLAVQPGYICFRLMENQHRSVPCFVRVIYSNAFFVCCGVSFMTLSAVTYERLVAVRLRARYNDVFTAKRVLKFMAAIWIVNIILTSLQWAGISDISKGIHYIIWFLCLLGSVLANIGIGLILRRHHRQLQPHSTISESIRKQRELKLTRNILFIVGVYLLFNMPLLFIKLYRLILKQDIKTYNHYSWTETLAFLNSCTNPLLCYWKSVQIRHGVIAIPERVARHLFSSDETDHVRIPRYNSVGSVTRYTVNTALVSLGVQ